MSVIQLMVTIIIVTILVTVILGVVSYIAYWLRRVRRPAQVEEEQLTPRFFQRYLPEELTVDAELDLAESGDESDDEAAVERAAGEPNAPVVTG